MQRDWELVRKILVALEELKTGDSLTAEGIAGYDKPTVSYHMGLLDEAGLIRARSIGPATAADACVGLSLTWEGHEFLDKVRNDNVWAKAKGVAKAKGLELSFDVIKLATKAVIEAMFGPGT